MERKGRGGAGKRKGKDFMLVREANISTLTCFNMYIFYCSYYLLFLIAVHATRSVCIRVDMLRYVFQHPVVTAALGSSAPV